jgi:hypothetical protein
MPVGDRLRRIVAPRSARSRVQPTGGTRTVVVHYHLFKCAGTSVDRTLKENFGPRWRELERTGRGDLEPEALAGLLGGDASIAAVSSHTLRLPPPDLPGTRLVPVLFLRHPMDRARSVYRFERVQQADTLGARMAKTLDMGQFFEWRLENFRKVGDRSLVDFQGWRLAQGSAAGSFEDRALATFERLPFVGVVERFERSLAELEAMLAPSFGGLRLRVYHENPSGGGPGEDQGLEGRLARLRAAIGEVTYQHLEAANQVDMMLWERAVARMSEGPAAPAEGTRRPGLG